MLYEAHAKVNLGLIVEPARNGLHPIRALNLSVSWADELSITTAPADELVVDGPAPADETNLAWKAVTAIRNGPSPPVRLELRKRIPSAAGLGGGSADAAAALVATARLVGAPDGATHEVAASVGADVPFCLVGGLAVVGGFGEHVRPEPAVDGFALAIAVPPFDLSTELVYRAWDEAGEPEGPAVPAASLPPALRGYSPLRNDLYPAAMRLRPAVEEWRSELAERWGRAVLLTGSGPSLFAFFIDADEAASALLDVPPGLRAAQAVVPEAQGWKVVAR